MLDGPAQRDRQFSFGYVDFHHGAGTLLGAAPVWIGD